MWRLLWWPVKWTLVLIGAYLALGLASIELRESRVGLGLGLVTALVLSVIKGLVMAWHSPQQPAPPAAPKSH